MVKERKVGVVSMFGRLARNLTKGAAEREACSQPDLTGWAVEKCKLVADLRRLARVWESNAGVMTIAQRNPVALARTLIVFGSRF